MVERWPFVCFMIQRIHMVCIDGLNKGKQAKYCKLNFFNFPQFLVEIRFFQRNAHNSTPKASLGTYSTSPDASRQGASFQIGPSAWNLLKKLFFSKNTETKTQNDFSQKDCSKEMAITRRPRHLWGRTAHHWTRLVKARVSRQVQGLETCLKSSYFQKYACDLGFAAIKTSKVLPGNT